ncbi:MAG: GNAT family N-acetyltransferase [Chloroflexi bacterium]|nr:GNAT family N-acetyltransferase [Chloroflexota bacterium]
MISIRRAILDDVSGISAVVHDVWAEDILPDVCAAQIQNDDCALWVATDGDDVVGFVSAFLTVGNSGERRWEVDLLAVRRSSQGQRLGRQLVLAARQDAVQRNVSVARAAIHVDNIASQKAFKYAGFVTDQRVHELLLWTPESGNVLAVCPNGVTLLPVDTLTYRGLWIEGLTGTELTLGEQRGVVKVARSAVAREDRLNTGAVIPKDATHLLPADLRNQASVQGEYYWFVKGISGD